MKSCNSYKKMLSEYIDNVLDKHNRTLLEAHLASCIQCRSLLEQMNHLKSSMRSLDKIKTSETFDAVLHARLVQQARHEHKRMHNWTPAFLLVNLKLPTVVAASLMLVFLGAALQRYYGAAPQKAPVASQFSDISHAVVEKATAANSGYMVVTQRDTVNNTIVITNYVHLDQVSSRHKAVQAGSKKIPLETLPDLKDAPLRQASTRPFSPNRNTPKIQYAKEYVF